MLRILESRHVFNPTEHSVDAAINEIPASYSCPYQLVRRGCYSRRYGLSFDHPTGLPLVLMDCPWDESSSCSSAKVI